MRYLYISFFLCLVAGKIFSQTETAAKKDSSSPRIVIRCQAPALDREPLYIVDGALVDIVFVRKMTPDNIESINVLKTDSMSALFCHPAMSGVIIITTKTGKLRQFSIKDFLEGDDIPGATLTFISLKNEKDSLRFVADEQGVVKTTSLKPGEKYKVEISSVGYKTLSATYKNTSSRAINQFLLERDIKLNEDVKVIAFGRTCRCPRTIACGGSINRSTIWEPLANSISDGSLSVSIYPNPLVKGGVIKAEINMQDEKPLQLRIINLNGSVLHAVAYHPFKGINRMEIPTKSQWAAGMYFVQILDEKGKLLKHDKLLIQ